MTFDFKTGHTTDINNVGNLILKFLSFLIFGLKQTVQIASLVPVFSLVIGSKIWKGGKFVGEAFGKLLELRCEVVSKNSTTRGERFVFSFNSV